MNRHVLAGAALAATLTFVGSAQAQPAGGYGYGCPGMAGLTGPGMMGPGMMGGYGMGPGMMGPGGRGQQGNFNLSANDVKANLERWISSSGNPHVKVGSVTQQDASTIVADIVTTDQNALVQRFAVDRSTGAYRSIQ